MCDCFSFKVMTCSEKPPPNIFVMFGGRVFQRTVGILMGTNCAPLLVDFILYLYEADFIQGLLKKNEKKLAQGRIQDFKLGGRT